jgi:hypothetical protein
MFLAVPVIGIVAVTWRSALRLLDPRAGGPDTPDDGPAQPNEVPVVLDPAIAGDLVADPRSQAAPAS